MKTLKIDQSLMAEYIAAKAARDAAVERLQLAVSAVIDQSIKVAINRVDEGGVAFAYTRDHSLDVCVLYDREEYICTAMKDGTLAYCDDDEYQMEAECTSAPIWCEAIRPRLTAIQGGRQQ